MTGATRIVVPASLAQRRLWFFEEYNPGGATYTSSALLRVDGPLDATRLERALLDIVQRHEILRTRFELRDWELVQVITSDAQFALPVADVGDLPEPERESVAVEQAHIEGNRPFDLSGGKLFRAKLWRCSATTHLLLLDLHQIVADERSISVLLREIELAYRRLGSGNDSRGKTLPVSPPPAQYADFSQWQRDRMQGSALEEHVSFWKIALAGAPAVLGLRADRPRPRQLSFRRGIERERLSAKLTKEIRAFASGEGFTPGTVLLAAFATLLYRHSGQADLVVGSSNANRVRDAFRSVIGPLVNPVVLRFDLSANPTFRELVARVARTCADAFAHEDMPFELLVDELQPIRDPGRHPVYQAAFEYPGQILDVFAVGDVRVTPLEFDRRGASTDLSLAIAEDDHGLSAGMKYNADLFDAAAIRRMLGHFHTLVEAVVENPELRIDSVPLLTRAEGEQLLVDWNRTKEPFPRDKCIHGLFEAQVERTPDSIAITFETESLTYRELNTRANQIAHHLIRLGVVPESRVGLFTKRSAEMVVGLLAVLKAGAAYVPLDPSYPRDRLALLLDDSAPAIVLTQPGQTPNFATDFSYPGIVLAIDHAAIEIRKELATNPETDVTPENMAYLIYTSGSTGRPKGVMVLHRGVVNYLAWGIAAYASASGNGAPVQSSLSFDLTVTSLFLPLLSGKTVHVLPELGGGTALASRLEHPTDWDFIKLTPGELTLLSSQLSPDRAARVTRALVVGGEALTTGMIAFWRAHAPNTRIINEYGPTETVVGCCVYEVGEEPLDGAVPIGRPIANTRLYILGADGQPVPIGMVGELCIGGEGVARGYWRQPELTAERFVLDPFGPDGSRMYRSGDFARYLPNGNIEYVGRRDSQVKLRGYRIELDEIEATLMGHRAVRRCAVLAVEDVPGDKRLVAWVETIVPNLSESDLRLHLKARLPAHMVPSAIAIQGTLPLTPNGKIDRRALVAPGPAARPSMVAPTRPRDATELRLTEIWEETLGRADVGVNDNYFDLGGHSLLAVKLFSRIREEFAQHLPLSTIFEAPTIDLLSRKLRDPRTVITWSSLVRMQGGANRVPLFLLPGAGGTLVGLADLLAHLSPDQPVFGLQAQGLNGRTTPLSSVEQMAEHYLREIMTMLPQGPFLLAGHSLGGVVAFEMARRLDAAGQRVLMVALLDASAVGKTTHAAALESLRKIRGRVRRLVDQGDASVSDNLPRQFREVREAADVAARMYEPPQYRGKVTLFRATTRWPGDPSAPDMGWARFALGGVEIRPAGGDHDTMLSMPHAEGLGRDLSDCIDSATGESRVITRSEIRLSSLAHGTMKGLPSDRPESA